MKTQHKAFSADVEISPDEPRTLVITASTAAVDYEGEVLIPQGCNTKNWEKNPVIFFNHRMETLPVGTGVSVKRSDDAVRIKLQFVERPPTYPANLDWMPDTLFWMYKKRAMRAASVGFLPVDGRVAGTRDKNLYGEDCQYVHSRWQLLELTLCPVGCNYEALAEAVSKGIMSQETADGLATKAADATEATPPAAKVEESAAAKGADDESGTPEMATCAECGKECVKAEMYARAPGDDDGEQTYLCGDCQPETGKSAPQWTVAMSEVAESLTKGLDDVLAATEVADAAPAVKEITREIATAKRVARQVDVAAPDAPPQVKHVHRFIEPPTPDVAVKTHKVVVRTLSKLRGRVWVDED